MRADEGFVHAWTMAAELETAQWRAMHGDMVLVLRAASRELERGRSDDGLAVLRGPEGLGSIRIVPDAIAFNGNAFLGEAADPFSVERIAERGIIARRTRSGERRVVRRCDTAGRPYDLAVCAVLLTMLHHCAGDVRVGTSGSLRGGWSRAAVVVRATLGDCGQLVQVETGLLRWVGAAASSEAGTTRSSAS
ncbi:MAG: hypothetical protein M3Z05_08990 [Gemmatimonadota bacterium]|nr:hypothetical protein [Gemmatimonadota bacterium]